MSKFKFINIVDLVFITFASFVLMFAWVQFFVQHLFLSLFISAFLTFTTILILRLIRAKKYNARQLILNNNANYIKFKLTIQTMPTTKLSPIIKQLIPEEYTPKISKDVITYTQNNQVCKFVLFFSSEVNEINLLEIIKNHPTSNLTIFCPNYTSQAKEITTAFDNKNITLINLEQLYEIFAQNNIIIPTNNIKLNQAKPSIKNILKKCISREKSKGYFVSGIILLLSSLLVPFRMYYLTISSILIVLSLVCRIKPIAATNKNIFK